MGFPTGYGTEHYIRTNTDIEYLIRFQNTGTDTAFRVVIRDTLSGHLLPSSIQLGTSSHPYIFTLNQQGILQFTFDQILLPDSNTNEAASHGFIKFRIAQQLDNPPGTVIHNEAAIYFDFNAPIVTNRTQHTIGENFIELIEVKTNDPAAAIAPLLVYPNPFQEQTTITWPDQSKRPMIFALYDSRGRLLREKRIEEDLWVFRREGLSAGIYFFQLHRADGSWVSGKLVLQ